jgi:opacity protein-like surface antigen
MIKRTTSYVLAACLGFAASASAQDRFVQGFGGLSLGSSFGLTNSSTDIGGVFGSHVTPNMMIVGEAGRIGNVLPPVADVLFDLSPFDYSASAWYAQGGVRFTTSNRSGIRPYAETSAGFARTSVHLNGSGLTNVLSNFGLQFLDRTDPIASAGGGVTFESGHLVADIGYRYRRIFSSDWLSTLALGDTLHSNEVRFGLGVKF